MQVLGAKTRPHDPFEVEGAVDMKTRVHIIMALMGLAAIWAAGPTESFAAKRALLVGVRTSRRSGEQLAGSGRRRPAHERSAYR